MQTTTTQETSDDDRDYEVLHQHLHHALAKVDGPLFTTDATGLFDTFLSWLPESIRQHYNCRSCRRFIDHFGGLVTVDTNGRCGSPFWNTDINGGRTFHNALDSVAGRIDDARITGVFLSSDHQWGISANDSPKAPGGFWRHMHAVAPNALRFSHPILTAGQASAEKREDYGTLQRGLAEFPIDVVRTAHTLLTTGVLYRSEKCIGVAKWMLELHEAIGATKNARLRENLVWRAVATAPPGFAHVRSTMIGTLLEDIQLGDAVDNIKRRFDAKMSPVQYQRPTAAPSDGQLAAAEALIAKMGASGSLARRFARLEEIVPFAIWTPKAEVKATGGGVFGHLKAKKEAAALDVPAQTVTWVKFRRDVLPTAERIEYLTPMNAPAPFFTFVTAENPDAPPILQWDREESRNPVSWYLNHGGSYPPAFDLPFGTYRDVEAITMQPSTWGGAMAHTGDGAYFIIRGAREKDVEGSGLGLFPEILKSEYHGIRAALEAYSRSKSISGVERSGAAGVCIQSSAQGSRSLPFRVTVGGARVLYTIDRFE